MQHTDLYVIETALDWLKQNKPIWVCTILSTYGSAPRGIGSVFVTDGKTRLGSISGGCLEDAFIEYIAQGRFTQPAEIFIYGNHATEIDIQRELPCGGTIRLLVELFPANQPSIQHCRTWIDYCKQSLEFNRKVSLTCNLKSLTFCTNITSNSVTETEKEVVLTYTQPFELLLIGIGPVSQQIAQLGLMAGFNVKICDTRRELASSWSFNLSHGGIDIDWMSPDLFVEKYAHSQSAVLALAHDPRLDDAALMMVFDTDAFYIGAMGSHKTSNLRVERLQRICEISTDKLARLHAPIGLNIGSKTPMEIAISTLADIIRVKNNITASQLKDTKKVITQS